MLHKNNIICPSFSFLLLYSYLIVLKNEIILQTKKSPLLPSDLSEERFPFHPFSQSRVVDDSQKTNKIIIIIFIQKMRGRFEWIFILSWDQVMCLKQRMTG